MNARGHRWGGVCVVSLVAIALFATDTIPVGERSLAALALALAGAYGLGSVPDRVDQVMGATHRNPVSHSLLFALFVGFGVFGVAFAALFPLRAVGVAPLAGFDWVSQVLVAGYAGSVVSGVISLHILFDLASEGGGFRVEPLGPVVDWDVALGLYTVRTGTADRVATLSGETSVVVLAAAVVDEGLLDERLQEAIARLLAEVPVLARGLV